MGSQSVWSKIREWIGGIAFAVLLWSARMTEEEYYDEQERSAQLRNEADSGYSSAIEERNSLEWRKQVEGDWGEIANKDAEE